MPRQETESQDFGDVSQYRELNAIGTGESREYSFIIRISPMHVLLECYWLSKFIDCQNVLL